MCYSYTVTIWCPVTVFHRFTLRFHVYVVHAYTTPHDLHLPPISTTTDTTTPHLPAFTTPRSPLRSLLFYVYLRCPPAAWSCYYRVTACHTTHTVYTTHTPRCYTLCLIHVHTHCHFSPAYYRVITVRWMDIVDVHTARSLISCVRFDFVYVDTPTHHRCCRVLHTCPWFYRCTLRLPDLICRWISYVTYVYDLCSVYHHRHALPIPLPVYLRLRSRYRFGAGIYTTTPFGAFPCVHVTSAFDLIYPTLPLRFAIPFVGRLRSSHTQLHLRCCLPDLPIPTPHHAAYLFLLSRFTPHTSPILRFRYDYTVLFI